MTVRSIQMGSIDKQISNYNSKRNSFKITNEESPIPTFLNKCNINFLIGKKTSKEFHREGSSSNKIGKENLYTEISEKVKNRISNYTTRKSENSKKNIFAELVNKTKERRLRIQKNCQIGILNKKQKSH